MSLLKALELCCAKKDITSHNIPIHGIYFDGVHFTAGNGVVLLQISGDSNLDSIQKEIKKKYGMNIEEGKEGFILFSSNFMVKYKDFMVNNKINHDFPDKLENFEQSIGKVKYPDITKLFLKDYSNDPTVEIRFTFNTQVLVNKVHKLLVKHSDGCVFKTDHDKNWVYPRFWNSKKEQTLSTYNRGYIKLIVMPMRWSTPV